MKGARWVGDQGMQAWKSYWQKPPDPNSPVVSPLPPANGFLPSSTHNPMPPTHANDEIPSRTISQRAVVSILDLEKLSASQSAREDVALQPSAAFALPDGCSLVSFTPNGLGLFTASAKGDVQHVWSLMRIAHGGRGIPAYGSQPRGERSKCPSDCSIYENDSSQDCRCGMDTTWRRTISPCY